MFDRRELIEKWNQFSVEFILLFYVLYHVSVINVLAVKYKLSNILFNKTNFNESTEIIYISAELLVSYNKLTTKTWSWLRFIRNKYLIKYKVYK